MLNSNQIFRVLAALSNILGLLCLILFYFMIETKNDTIIMVTVLLAIILFIVTVYLLFFRHFEDVIKRKLDIYQLTTRLLIPILIFSYWVIYT